MIPEEVQNWLRLWKPQQELAGIFDFAWSDLVHLREAITALLITHMETITVLNVDVLDEIRFLQIKMLIASNPDTPQMVLEYLSGHSSPRVLERIAENPNTPFGVLERLCASEHAEVRSAVAENSQLPPNLVKGLSEDENPDIRYKLAENFATPIEVLRTLEGDENPYVAHRARATLARLQSGWVREADFQKSQAPPRRNARPAY